MSQIGLPFDWPASEDERDFFLTNANARVVAHLDHWSHWPVMTTVLSGPRKSGRSLLARIFTAKTGGEMIDDAERQDEEMLFHAWNRAQERRRPLLVIADAPPPAWEITLPDLRSRIAASPKVTMEEPDEDLMALLIEKLLVARGLPVTPDVLRFLLPRIERTYLSLHRLVEALDAAALARRVRLSVPLAREVLRAMGVIDESRQAG
ncbi:DnaA/Hda family protein [Sphingomonas naphthae]|uniref:DnaA/Hda family protein n=1 Tax=Sphingomonas naphthae TaxID=1813468 RepID=A0ABY7TQJ4_9SPHN|nr:DnaA/Hda family protein [Sphingomonas naphthae]WCT75210.1 DnaA/Hda family protein [Sphingomonas naphthae]